MKTIILTAIAALVSTLFVNAQNYYIAVFNYTSISYELGTTDASNDCQQTDFANCLVAPGNYSLRIGSTQNMQISGAPGPLLGMITIFQ